MSERSAEEAEIVRIASEKAQAGIAAMRAERLAEGHTEADLAMMHALAEQVVIDRLNRGEMGPPNSKGRQAIILHGEPTEAERHWQSLMKPREPHVVEGGPHIGKSF